MNDNRTLPLAEPYTYKRPLGDFIVSAFGDLAVPAEKRDMYDEARSEARMLQADAVIQREGGILERVLMDIDSGKGTHDDVTGFGEILNSRLPRNEFGRDIVVDALLLQACGRIVFVMNNQLDPAELTPPKMGNERNPHLVAAQNALKGLLIRRRQDGRHPTADRHAIRTAVEGITMLMEKYADQDDFARHLHGLARIGIMVSTRTRTPDRRPKF